MERPPASGLSAGRTARADSCTIWSDGGTVAGTEKIFRVFVSSTFADMIAERTVLQERVFPRLEAYCRERGGRFKAIHLRWGVSMR